MKRTDREKLVKYRITKARTTLDEVQLLIDNELWNTAINRLYYACYYAVIALLLDKGIQPKTHNGVRQMFGLHFIKTGVIDTSLGKFFTDLFDLRQTGDYDDYIEFTGEDLADLIKPANELILKAEELLSIK